MKISLGMKLFLSYLSVIIIGMLVLLAVAQVSLPSIYGRHMVMMNGSGMMGAGNGRGTGNAGGAFQDFRSSFYEALGWAGLAAFIVALVVSFLISKSLTAPLKKMKLASQRMAEGNYKERVLHGGNDELGELALSFNTMAEKLEQVENMRRRLIGDVAHELRTPLAAIKGSMEGLVDGVLPASRETYEQVEAEADRLTRLVSSLQELSQVESGAFQLNLNAVSLPEIGEILQKRIEKAYSAKGVRLLLNFTEELPPVRADAEKLLQVLTNLLNNALSFTPAGGKVTCAAEAHGNGLTIRVTDTGIGIAPEHIQYLFDRFYRVDPSRSRAAGGSGIGLAISKHLAEAQGGRIWAESEGEGKGSTFFFTIPLA